MSPLNPIVMEGPSTYSNALTECAHRTCSGLQWHISQSALQPVGCLTGNVTAVAMQTHRLLCNHLQEMPINMPLSTHYLLKKQWPTNMQTHNPGSYKQQIQTGLLRPVPLHYKKLSGCTNQPSTYLATC